MTRSKHHLIPSAILFVTVLILLAGCSGNKETVEETQAATVRDLQAGDIPELSYTAADSENWNRAISENKISKEFSEALSRFSFQTSKALLQDTADSQIFSPLSIYFALALADVGAEGETKDELEALLRINNTDELTEECHRLMLSLSYGQQRCRAIAVNGGAWNYKSCITLADSVWFSKNLVIKEEYQQKAADEFYASSYSVNFENPDSNARIQYWIRDMTNGVIYPKINLPSETLMAIVNTLYYYGAWQNPFDEEATVEDDFSLGDGESVAAAFYCCRTDAHGYVTDGDGFTLASLPTDNGCEMVVFLPDKDRTADEFLETPDRLRVSMETQPKTQCTLVWKIPKFSFGSSYSLISALKKLGVSKMFTDYAGFGGISDEGLYVSDILHEAHISLDEQGMEGAAYTLMAMNETALTQQEETYEMICDHPFIFGVRERNTGAWLFLGVCRNPAE